MGIQIQGNNGVISEVSGTGFRSLRTENRPIDHAAFGHYRFSQTIVLPVSAAVNASQLSWRWGDASRFAVLTKLRLSVLQTAAATATIMPRFQCFIARAFTASDSAGTGFVPTGNQMKKRTNMGTSLLTDVRFSTVAAGLTTGTRTLDTTPFMELPTQQTITTPNTVLYEKELEIDMGHGNHPYVFAQNEGIVVRGPSVVFGAAGTADLTVDMSWIELGAF